MARRPDARRQVVVVAGERRPLSLSREPPMQARARKDEGTSVAVVTWAGSAGGRSPPARSLRAASGPTTAWIAADRVGVRFGNQPAERLSRPSPANDRSQTLAEKRGFAVARLVAKRRTKPRSRRQLPAAHSRAEGAGRTASLSPLSTAGRDASRVIAPSRRPARSVPRVPYGPGPRRTPPSGPPRGSCTPLPPRWSSARRRPFHRWSG